MLIEVKVKYLLGIFMSFFASNVFAQPVSATYNANGTFSVPAGYTANVKIDAWGAGGGGGGDNFSDDGGAGGGGAYSSKTLTLAAGNYSVIVGKGGAGSYRPELPIGSGTGSFDGGNSSFGGTIVIANGGKAGGTFYGGAGGAASADASGYPGAFVSFAGGNGGRAVIGNTYGPGGGGSATPTGNGENGKNPTALDGGAGGAGSGTGGEGGSVGDPAGNGYAPGGGGGGKFVGHRVSGGGADGRVIVTVENYQTLPVTFGTISAVQEGKTLTVNWIAEKEDNNNHFEVEASKDGVHFEKIGTVQSKTNGVQSGNQQKYSFSIAISETIAFLGMSIFGIFISGFFVSRRLKTFALLAMISGAALFYTSCQKSTDSVQSNNEKLFIRIAQVDKDGGKTYSKIMQVVNQ